MSRPFNLGGALAYLRWREKMSQMELAERLRVPRSYVSKVENNRCEPSLRYLPKFAEALGVTVAEIVELSATEIAKVFSHELARELAKRCPLQKCERVAIVRFINAKGKHHVAAAAKERSDGGRPELGEGSIQEIA